MYALLSYYDINTLLPFKAWLRETGGPGLWAPLDEPVHTAQDIRVAVLIRLALFAIGVVAGYLLWPLIGWIMTAFSRGLARWATHQPRERALGTVAGLVGGLLVAAGISFLVIVELRGAKGPLAADPWLQLMVYGFLALLLGSIGAVIGRGLARPKKQ